MPRRQDACCRQSHSSPRWKPRRIKAVATFSLTRFLQRRVQKSDKLTSASFQPPAVVPSGSRKTPLKRSRSSPAAQPLGSLGGTASRSRPCFPPSSSPVFPSKKPSQAVKHRKRWDNRRDELLRLSLRLSKLSRCFLLGFGMFGERARSNRQKNGDRRMARFFCPHSPVEPVFQTS
jgi:hypothetical protein